MSSYHETANNNRIKFHYVLRYDKLQMKSLKIAYKFHINTGRTFFVSFLSYKEDILNTWVKQFTFISTDLLSYQYFKFLLALVLPFSLQLRGIQSINVYVLRYHVYSDCFFVTLVILRNHSSWPHYVKIFHMFGKFHRCGKYSTI